MKRLDFAIIGAGKSGTTSLFRYLSAHPEIYMPAVKELSFFAYPKYYSRGINWYYSTYFLTANHGLLWGEASPAYMMYAATPQRINQANPAVKLIAILRNPVDRAFSHHQHLVRAGRETRSFGECIDRLVHRGVVADERIETSGDWHSEYVMDGEYGRLLENYLRHFPREQLKLCFFEDLQSDPVSLVTDLYDWLGVNSQQLPPIIGKVFNPGGSLRFPFISRSLEWSVRKGLRVRWLNDLLQRLGVRSKLAEYWFRFKTEFAVRHSQIALPEGTERQFLTTYYRNDVRKLDKLFGFQTPWKDFHSNSRTLDSSSLSSYAA